MTVLLRDYQSNLIRRFWDAVDFGQRRALIVAPTGAGKTVIAGQLVADALQKWQRVLFLAHRRELITQASGKLHAIGIDHGIVQAGYPTRPSERAQVASVSTLHARAVRSTRMDMPPADLVIIDEAHHVRARTYQQIIEAYPDAVIAGLTATPCRGDGRGLGNDFDCLLECPQVPDLIAAGHLVGTKVYAPHTPDLDGVHTARGDYVEAELADRMDRSELIGDIVTHWHKLAERRPTVVFATSVAHSVNLRDEFRRSGVMAEHLDGSTPTEQREGILAKLKSGATDVIVNCAVLTEGFDCPEIGCIVLARPTKSMLLYRQMVGRALRPAPSKTHALILDHAGATFQHGFAEEPIEWTLAPDRKAVNKTQSARAMASAPGLTTCPECKAIRTAGQPCGACGWQPRAKPQGVEVRDGNLGLLDRSKRVAPAFTQAERDTFHQELAWIAQDRGYKPGWASFKYKEKFGEWPRSKFAVPRTPSPATRSWVRSRQIAYAKGMAKDQLGAAR